MAVPNWWDEFFAETWAHVQAGGYPAERTAEECDLIEAALRLQPNARVLDIPCGIGRHSVELARRGFRMTGVELKPDHVASAKASATSAGVDAHFLTGDMREFVSSDPFDSAFCYFGSFGYFSEADNGRFIQAVFAALGPGGRFLIEGHVTETLLPVYREKDWVWAGPPDKRVPVLEERSWNIATSRIESTWTIVDERGRRPVTTSMRIYTCRELRMLLEAAGFVDVDVRDGKTGEPFRMGAPRAVFVAKKRG